MRFAVFVHWRLFSRAVLAKNMIAVYHGCNKGKRSENDCLGGCSCALYALDVRWSPFSSQSTSLLSHRSPQTATYACVHSGRCGKVRVRSMNAPLRSTGVQDGLLEQNTRQAWDRCHNHGQKIRRQTHTILGVFSTQTHPGYVARKLHHSLRRDLWTLLRASLKPTARDKSTKAEISLTSMLQSE